MKVSPSYNIYVFQGSSVPAKKAFLQSWRTGIKKEKPAKAQKHRRDVILK